MKHANQITLRMSLQHMSGIHDWLEDRESPCTTSLKKVDEYLELIPDGTVYTRNRE